MGLAVAIQMDPIESVNIDADSTFVLALEAQARGHALYHYLPRNLTLADGRLYAKARRLEVRREQGRHHTLGAVETLDLAGLDVILMRQDPPFDMAYITATHLLEHVSDQVLVVNDPAARAQCAGEARRHALPRADAADPHHQRPRRDRGLPRQARRHHPEAAVRQWRRRRVPPAPRRREPERAPGDLHPALSRADHGAALSAGGARRATSASC